MPAAVPGADDTGVNNRHDLFSWIDIYKGFTNIGKIIILSTRKKTTFSSSSFPRG